MSICGEWEVNRLRQSCDNPARTCVSLSHDPWNQPRRITRYYWLTFSFFLIFTIFQTLHHAMETLNILRCLEIESWQNFAKIRIWNWKYLENLRLQKFKRRIEEFWNLKIGRFEDYLKDNLEKNCKKCNEIYFKSLRSWEIDTLNVQNIEKIENCVVGNILFFFCWNYFS